MTLLRRFKTDVALLAALEDPAALKAPWTTEHYYKRQLPGYEMEEYVCTNNRNAEDEKGAQTAK